MLGATSKNLFVIECKNKSKFEEICCKLGGKARWLTQTPQGYQIWLISSDGELMNYQASKYEIKGRRSWALVPPYITREGELISWLFRDGELPPAMSLEEITRIFPGVTVHKSISSMVRSHDDAITFHPHLDIFKLMAWAFSHKWTGNSSQINKAVFLELCNRASFEEIVNFRATAREVGSAVGISTNSANKAIKRLVTQHLITVKSKRGLGYRYEFLVDVQSLDNNLLSYFIVQFLNVPMNHDVWFPTALGRSSYFIYLYLLEATSNGEGLPRSELLARTQMNRTTFKRNLDKLEGVHLAKLENGLWYAIPASEEELDALAKSFRVFGKGAERKELIEQQRKYYSVVDPKNWTNPLGGGYDPGKGPK